MEKIGNLVKLVLMGILTTATTLGFNACTSDDNQYSQETLTTKSYDRTVAPQRTVLIYMAGKSDLSTDTDKRHYLNEDLEEIKQGSRLIGDDDCLLVFVRRYQVGNAAETPWLARIWNGEVVDSVSVADMGIENTDARACDPEVMEQVMSYAFNHYPAKRDYGLVLWSHSTGWMIEDEMPVTRAFGLDKGNTVGTTGKWINIPTMSKVLSRLPHLRFIMADCCNFMCLESLYELRGVADYVIGSPAEIPGRGAPYDKIVTSLFEHETFYTSIVDKYQASVKGKLPLSVVKMSEMENVAQATARVMQSVNRNLSGNYPDMTGVIHYGHYYKYPKFLAENNLFYDAGDFISRYAPASDYQQWKQALDKAVVKKHIAYAWNTQESWDVFYADFKMTEEKFHGVSMFVPQNPSTVRCAQYNEDIKQMQWYYAINK